MSIYQCLVEDDRYSPPLLTLVYEARTEREAIDYLRRIGGGVYQNLLHNFRFRVTMHL